MRCHTFFTQMTMLATLLVYPFGATAELTKGAVDGDTLYIGEYRIRVANIDTPEIGTAQCDAEKRLGLVAKRRADQLLNSGTVIVHIGDPGTGRTKDRYGRTLATLSIDGRDFGEIMINEGLARPWTGKRRSWCERN